MPKNNSSTRRAERKQAAELRQVEANESGKTPREREAARGFTSGKRWS